MLPFNGSTLLQSVINLVQPMFPLTLLSVREPRKEIALPQVLDKQTNGGPLAGLVSALEIISTPWAFVVACDMPFIAPAMIEHLATLRSGSQAVIPLAQGYAQPLLAFYAQSCLPALREHLVNGNKSLLGALEKLDPRLVVMVELPVTDMQLRSFIDLDTPQDVMQAEAMKR
jgi:molybdopterin-guanine dinucleotide biosynthesis protein A